MTRILLSITIVFLFLSLIIGCSRKENSHKVSTRQQNDKKSEVSVEINSDVIELNDYNNIKYEGILIHEIIEKNSITNFFIYEIMNGNNNLSFHRDKYAVIDIFGEPLDINCTGVSFNMAGGTVIELRELIYDDFKHIYYVFEGGTIFYIGFIIEKRLERLKKINIGDTKEKLLSTFVDDYFSWNGRISFHTEPVTCEIQFIHENDIIVRIFVNFYLA